MSAEILSSHFLIDSLPVLGLAFSAAVRHLISKRADGVSEISGVAGTSMDAMHLDHTRDETYDSPERGLFVTITEHLLYHVVHRGRASEIGLSEEHNEAAINLISARMGEDHYENTSHR